MNQRRYLTRFPLVILITLMIPKNTKDFSCTALVWKGNSSSFLPPSPDPLPHLHSVCNLVFILSGNANNLMNTSLATTATTDDDKDNNNNNNKALGKHVANFVNS